MVDAIINQNDGFVSITATGGETTLSGDFPIFEKAHVTIKRQRSGTTTTLVLNTDYTIADAQLEVTAGFTAVLAGSSTPAVAGDIYTLLLDVPEARTTDFIQAGDFFAAALNEEFDLEIQMIQQLRRDVDKSAHLPDTSTISSVILPEPIDGALIGWDGTDGTMANYTVDDLGGIPISSFGADFVNDTTASAGRTTLGATSIGNALFITASASAARSTLGVIIGTDVQAFDAAILSAWSAYTPTITPSSGSFVSTSRVGRFRKVGKTVEVQMELSITSAGTGSGSVAATLPFAAASGIYIIPGRENVLTASMLQGRIPSASSGMDITTFNNGSPIGTGAVLIMTGIYQSV